MAMISRRILLGGLAAMAAPARGESDVVLPIDLDPIGKPIIGMTLDGKGPYRFIIDTGAAFTSMHDSLLQKAGLTSSQEVGITGFGTKGRASLYRARDIVVGGRVHQPGMVLFGLRDLPLKDADGLLGAGFLTHRPSLLDFVRREVRYLPDAPDLDGFVRLDAQEAPRAPGTDGRWMVRVTLDGLPLTLIVDTGAASELALHGPAVKAHKLWERYPRLGDAARKSVTGDKISQRIVRVPNLDLGGVTMAITPVSLSDPASDAADRGFDGVLGIRTLRQLALAFTSDGLAVKPSPGVRTTKTDPWKQSPPRLTR